MADIIEYLKGNPVEVDHEKIQFEYLGNRLIGKERGRYVGEEIRSWKQELKPDESHRDTQTNLDLGKLAPGCYLLESKLEGGNTSWVVVWVRDLVLLKRSEAGNEVFYLVDAADGSPVAGELEFFGYRTDYLEKAQGKRRFNVVTRNFKRNTNADGKLVLDEVQEDGNLFQWHVIARAGERRAFLSSHRFQWSDNSDRTDYLAQKTIGITDRPVYRPGQKVYVKLWAGEARYDLGEVSTYAGKTADIEIRDGRNELIVEKKVSVRMHLGASNSISISRKRPHWGTTTSESPAVVSRTRISRSASRNTRSRNTR